jgi:nucleoside triphosphate pyrophosphatase
VAGRGDVEGAQARLSAAPSPPILLASTSPQRRAILEQLGLPFDVVPPRYEEHDPPDADPAVLVREHAQGKARSVANAAGGRPVLGVDTTVVCDGQVYGKAEGPEQATTILGALGGTTHEVVSGLCLLTPAWEELHTETTRVTFRALTARDVAAYVAAGEWEGRAGAYAIQGLGAGFVERIEGDYLNVVGLPAALLVRVLAERFPGLYGFG